MAEDGARPGSSEDEICRGHNVVLYERQVAGRRGRTRAGSPKLQITHWHRHSYEEVVVTNQRVVFAQGGKRDRQLCTDPKVASDVARTLQNDSGSFDIGKDRAASIPFIVGAREVQYFLRPLWMPKSLRLLAVGIALIVALVLLVNMGIVGLILGAALIVVLTRGYPNPWKGIRFGVMTGEHANHYAINPGMRLMARAIDGRYRLLVPDAAEHERVMQAITAGEQQAMEAFRAVQAAPTAAAPHGAWQTS